MWYFLLNRIKNLILVCLVVYAGYFIYNIINSKNFDIKDQIVVYHAHSLNSKTMDLISLKNYVNIKGTMKNTSQDHFKDITLYYSLGKDTLKAKIYDLMPGEEMKFMTNYCFIDEAAQDYKLENVTYKKEKE